MKWKLPEFRGEDCFFTSDLHLYHSNIIPTCKRPFENVEEMNEVLIENWNKTVQKDSHVFNMGDFIFGGVKVWEEITSRLNGHHHLILGNHDYKQIRAINPEHFTSINDILQIRIIDDNQLIMCCHYPFLTWGGYERGVWNAYGHYHTQEGHILANVKPTQYDVGVDRNNFKPLSYLELKGIIETQIKNEKLIRTM